MNPEVLSQLFARDFEKLETEIFEYQAPDNLWAKGGNIKNSGGNLALHLAGNLEHYLGSTFLNSGYKRDRSFEFNGKVNLDELIRRVRAAKQVVQQTLQQLSPSDFDDYFPLKPFGYEMTNEFFFMHLYSHFTYHLGQINYHRRLLDH